MRWASTALRLRPGASPEALRAGERETPTQWAASCRSPALGLKLSPSFSESPLGMFPHPVRSCERIEIGAEIKICAWMDHEKWFADSDAGIFFTSSDPLLPGRQGPGRGRSEVKACRSSSTGLSPSQNLTPLPSLRTYTRGGASPM